MASDDVSAIPAHGPSPDARGRLEDALRGRQGMTAGAESTENDWKELAERLLHVPYPGGPARAAEVLLHRLPDEFPADVPVPQDWRLIGSKKYGRAGRPWVIEAVFDAQGTEADLIASYESQVMSGGWSTYESPMAMPGGFTSGITVARREFRVAGEGPLLRITVTGRDNLPADVRLVVDWESLRRMASRPHGIPPSAERMPALRTPAGVPMGTGSSGGYEERRCYSYAIAKTDMPTSALEAHLAGQFVAAGWTRIAGTVDDVATWSSWRLPGNEDWRGLLLVLAALAPNQRCLFLQIEAADLDDE